MEIAVVGSEDFVLGFQLAGVRKTYGADQGDMEKVLEEVIQDEDIGILVLKSDEMARLSLGMKRRLSSLPRPVVIAVGGEEEEDLRSKVKRAIGIDLFKT
jgi:V/A-type H+-transporting ATPase subunit F